MKKRIRLYKGLPIVDAEKGLDIIVTKKDISSAKPNDPKNCAAALAGKRLLQREVEVHISRTYVREKDHWTRYITPESASREIVSFDRSGKFAPGEYCLNVPSPGAKLGQYRGKSTRKSERKRPRHMTANVRAKATWK